jgi:uncharacterized membrane protein SpoIIM required for sporulation
MLEARRAPVMKSLRFRQEREAVWNQLEELIFKIDKQGRQSLTTEECLALPRLYRSTLSSLSVARAISLDSAVVRYLETLTLKAYIHVYGSRAHIWDVVLRFFTHDWPQMVRKLWQPILFATLIFLGAWGIAHMLVASNAEWFYTFLGEEMAGGRTPTASKAFLRSTLFDDSLEPKRGLAIFAAFLFNNNASVTLFAFALGFALGVPTILLMFQNGAMGGALSAVFARHGLAYDLYGWLIIHGSTEITAIVMGAGAGLHMGAAVAFPREVSRVDALRAAGRDAAVVGMGCVVMLFVAGLLEGFARQLVQDTAMRYAIGVAMFVFWMSYFGFAGRRRT